MKINIAFIAGFVIINCFFNGTVQTKMYDKVTTRKQLDDIVKNHKTAVVEISLPGCGHCNKFKRSKAFQHLSDKYPSTAFVEVNSTTMEPALRKQYPTTGYPTFYFVKDGKQVPAAEMKGGDEESVGQNLKQIMEK